MDFLLRCDFPFSQTRDEFIHLSYFPISLIIGVLNTAHHMLLSLFFSFFIPNLLWLIATKPQSSPYYTFFLLPSHFPTFFFHLPLQNAKNCKKVAKLLPHFFSESRIYFFLFCFAFNVKHSDKSDNFAFFFILPLDSLPQRQRKR